MDNICIDCRNSEDCILKPITNQWTVAGCPWFEEVYGKDFYRYD